MIYGKQCCYVLIHLMHQLSNLCGSVFFIHIQLCLHADYLAHKQNALKKWYATKVKFNIIAQPDITVVIYMPMLEIL